MKYRTKQPSSFQNNDACIIEDTQDAAQASCQVSHSLTEAGWSSDMWELTFPFYEHKAYDNHDYWQ